MHTKTPGDPSWVPATTTVMPEMEQAGPMTSGSPFVMKSQDSHHTVLVQKHSRLFNIKYAFLHGAHVLGSSTP